MRTKYKAWAKPYLSEHPDIVISKEEVLNMSGYALEIGTGKGQFITTMATKNPDVTFLGLECNTTIAGYCAKNIVESGVNNAFLCHEFAEHILPEIKAESVSTIYLNFPDPWPKGKHEKRRLTSQEFVKQYYRILKKDGYLYFKTDNHLFYEYTVQSFKNSIFGFVTYDLDYKTLDENDAISEYEESFRNEGDKIYRLILKK